MQAHQQRPTARKRAWLVDIIGKSLYIKFKMEICIKPLSILLKSYNVIYSYVVLFFSFNLISLKHKCFYISQMSKERETQNS